MSIPRIIAGWLLLAVPGFAALPGTVVQLMGPAETRPLPDVSDAIDVAVVAWGEQFGAAVRADGSVVAWGGSYSGSVAAPAGTRNVVKLAAGDLNILALQSDGTVVSFPKMTINGNSLEAPAGLTDAVDIAAGNTRCYAVRTDGSVVSWGDHANLPAGLANVAHVSAGCGGFDMALKKDGTVVTWSPYDGSSPPASGHLAPPAGLANVVAVAAGYDHALALLADGTVRGWGTTLGAMPPAGLTDVVQIAAGQNFSVALKRDGQVVTWGSPNYGETSISVVESLVGASKIATGRAGAVVIYGPRALDRALSIPLSAGYDVTLGAPTATPAGATFAWQKNGVPLTGQTGRNLTIGFAQVADSGTYNVAVTSQGNTTVSPGATVTITAGNGQKAYLANLSSRGLAGTGENTMIAGLVNIGSSSRQTLFRGVGPSLVHLGVNEVLPDPSLNLIKDNRVIASNDGWDAGGNGDLMTYYFDQVGAFHLDPGSHDTAVHVALIPGLYSAQVTSGGTPMIALMECYDATLANELPQVQYGGVVSGRMVNLSTRALVGTGEKALIAGLVIQGSGSQRLLIRGVGPGLIPLGVTTPVAACHLQINQNARIIAENTGWSNGPDANAIEAAATQVGAFSLTRGSTDTAVLLDLQPGAYTAQLTPQDTGDGVGLVEVYEVDR